MNSKNFLLLSNYIRECWLGPIFSRGSCGPGDVHLHHSSPITITESTVEPFYLLLVLLLLVAISVRECNLLPNWNQRVAAAHRLDTADGHALV